MKKSSKLFKPFIHKTKENLINKERISVKKPFKEIPKSYNINKFL